MGKQGTREARETKNDKNSRRRKLSCLFAGGLRVRGAIVCGLYRRFDTCDTFFVGSIGLHTNTTASFVVYSDRDLLALRGVLWEEEEDGEDGEEGEEREGGVDKDVLCFVAVVCRSPGEVDGRECECGYGYCGCTKEIWKRRGGG